MRTLLWWEHLEFFKPIFLTKSVHGWSTFFLYHALWLIGLTGTTHLDSDEFNLTFANNIFSQQLPTLLDVTCCVRCMLHKLWNCSNFSVNNSHHFSLVPWSPTHSTMLNVGSVCTALPTMLGPCTQITHSLLGVYKVIRVVSFPRWHVLQLPTLLGVDASVCTPLPTTPNTFDATMLGVVCQLACSLSPVA